MFTEKDLKEIQEVLGEEYAKKIQQLMTLYQIREKEHEEIQEGLRKIFSKPSAMNKFKEAIEEAGLNLEIPSSPYEEVEKKIDERLSKIEKEKEREEILRLLEEHGIPQSEWKDLIEFQKKYHIQDNKAAIELYAQMRARRMELEPVSVSFERPKEWSYEDAKRRTLEEIAKLRAMMAQNL